MIFRLTHLTDIVSRLDITALFLIGTSLRAQTRERFDSKISSLQMQVQRWDCWWDTDSGRRRVFWRSIPRMLSEIIWRILIAKLLLPANSLPIFLVKFSILNATFSECYYRKIDIKPDASSCFLTVCFHLDVGSGTWRPWNDFEHLRCWIRVNLIQHHPDLILY